MATWLVFHEREAPTVDHSVKQYVDNFCLPVLEKSGTSQGISCGLESGHPASGTILMTVLIINRSNFVHSLVASGFLSSPLLFYETSRLVANVSDGVTLTRPKASKP